MLIEKNWNPDRLWCCVDDCVFFHYRLPIMLTRQSLFRSILFFSAQFGCVLFRLGVFLIRGLYQCVSLSNAQYIYLLHTNTYTTYSKSVISQSDRCVVDSASSIESFFLSVGRHKTSKHINKNFNFLNIYCLFFPYRSRTDIANTWQVNFLCNQLFDKLIIRSSKRLDEWRLLLSIFRHR